MPVVARPSGRSIFVGVAIRERPFHVRIARRRPGWWSNLQRHPRRTLGQNHEAAAPWALEAHARCILVALRSRDALVVIRASPGVVSGPRARGRHLENSVGLWARDRP